MKKLILIILLLFLVGCKPTTENNPNEQTYFKGITLNEMMLDLLQSETIGSIEYIHDDVIVALIIETEDSIYERVIRYDEKDGIILDVTYENRFTRFTEEPDGAIRITNGLSSESVIEIYEEDGTLLASAENVYYMTDSSMIEYNTKTIFKNPIDGLYYGTSYEPSGTNLINTSIIQYKGSNETNIYELEVSPNWSSEGQYKCAMLPDGTFLLHYVPVDNTNLYQIQQIDIDGTVLVEDSFTEPVDIDLLSDGYVTHSNGTVKRYSANG